MRPAICLVRARLLFGDLEDAIAFAIVPFAGEARLVIRALEFDGSFAMGSAYKVHIPFTWRYIDQNFAHIADRTIGAHQSLLPTVKPSFPVRSKVFAGRRRRLAEL